jgi:hypothetical protein
MCPRRLRRPRQQTTVPPRPARATPPALVSTMIPVDRQVILAVQHLCWQIDTAPRVLPPVPRAPRLLPD